MNKTFTKRIALIIAVLAMISAMFTFSVTSFAESESGYPGYVDFVISNMDEAPEFVSEEEYADYAAEYLDNCSKNGRFTCTGRTCNNRKIASKRHIDRLALTL